MNFGIHIVKFLLVFFFSPYFTNQQVKCLGGWNQYELQDSYHEVPIGFIFFSPYFTNTQILD